jgi:hypothetical protein
VVGVIETVIGENQAYLPAAGESNSRHTSGPCDLERPGGGLFRRLADLANQFA